MSKIVNLSAGEILYSQYSKPEGIYILQKGSVEIIFEEHEAAVEKHVIEEGQFFGIWETLTGFYRTCSIVAIEDSSCIMLSVHEFETMILSKQNLFEQIVRGFNKLIMYKEMKYYGEVNKKIDLEGACGISKAFLHLHNPTAAFEVINKYMESSQELKDDESLAYLRKVAETRCNSITSEGKTPLDQFLDSNKFFAPKNENNLFNISAFKNLMNIFDNGEVIFAELEKSEKFYYIESGEVIACKYHDGQMRYTRVYSPGEFIGLHSCLLGLTYGQTCIAKGLVKVLEFNRANFDAIFDANTQMRLMLLRQLANTIFSLDYNNTLANTKATVREKLAMVLSYMCMRPSFSKVDESLLSPKDVDNLTERTRQIFLDAGIIANWIGCSATDIEDRLKYLESRELIKRCPKNIIIIYDSAVSLK